MKIQHGSALDDAVEIRLPAPDSQFRLMPCRCKSDHVAYVKYLDGDEEKWRVRCFDCGNTVDKGPTVQHEAQLAWNARAKEGWA